MATTLKINPRNFEGFLRKLDSYAFSLVSGKSSPDTILRKDLEPYFRGVFDRTNATFRRVLATTTQRPGIASVFVRPRSTARPEAITYASGELYNSLRYSIQSARRGGRREINLRIFSTSDKFDLSDDPTKRTRISLRRVRFWLEQKFGISTATDPRTLINFNPRGGRPIRYDQLVFSVWRSINQAQDNRRYKGQGLARVITDAIARSRGNQDVRLLQDRIARKIGNLDRLTAL